MKKLEIKKIIGLLAIIGLFSFSAQAQRNLSYDDRIDELQFQLEELEDVSTYSLTRSERKQLKEDKKKLRKKIQRMQLAEWRRVRARNPYARSSYYNDFYGGYYNAPGFFYRRPVYRVRTIRCR